MSVGGKGDIYTIFILIETIETETKLTVAYRITSSIRPSNAHISSLTMLLA